MANQGSTGNFVFVSDISQGKAKYPIQIIGPQDDDSFSTSNFNFVYNLRPQFNFSSDMPKRQFCICGPDDDCSTNDRCLCVNRSKVKMAKRERIGNIDALGENGFSSTLFECTPECGCAGHCGNRLIPDGQRNQFEIFKKPNVGFACRTLKSIRKGNFVSCLAGEVLPESPDDLKPKSTSNNPPGFAFQDKTLQLGFFVRTDRLANESRFFNNGCCPNLVPIFVYSKTAIMERPIVVFVARHEINPQEELTFYYGDYWFLRILRDNPKFKCRCNSPFCIWPPAIEDDEEEEEILIERLRTERINKDREISCERHEKKKKYHQNRVLQCSSQSNTNTTSQGQDERADN